MPAWCGQITRGLQEGYCCNHDFTQLIDPVMRLFIPNDLATIVTEIVLKSLAPFGYRTAHSTDPPLRSAKASPRLILFAFGIVGAHDVRKYSSARSRFLRAYAVRPPRERIVDVNRRLIDLGRPILSW